MELTPGDLLLYTGDWMNPVDAAIMARTRSTVVHVSIVLLSNPDAENATICAATGGIQFRPAGSYAYVVTTGSTVNRDRLQNAIMWVTGKVGEPYGWADIANQALDLLGKDMVMLDKSYDCSHLACDFLWIAGVALPAAMIDEFTVTPGDLYRAAQGMSLLVNAKGEHV